MEMTIEKAYQGMKEYFSRPGAEICMINGSCVYRNPHNDTKCAVGCLIPDEQYNERMEGLPASEVVTEIGWHEKRLLDFLDDAQQAHDNNYHAVEFVEELDKIYEKYRRPQ